MELQHLGVPVKKSFEAIVSWPLVDNTEVGEGKVACPGSHSW